MDNFLPSYEASMRDAKEYLRRRDLSSQEEIPLYFAWERLYAAANTNLSIDFLNETRAERCSRQQARLAPRRGLPPPLFTSFDTTNRRSMQASVFLRSGTSSSAAIELMARRYRREAEKLRLSRGELVSSLDNIQGRPKKGKRRQKTRELELEDPEDENEQLQATRGSKASVLHGGITKTDLGGKLTFDSLLVDDEKVFKKGSLRQTSVDDSDPLRSPKLSAVANVAAFAAEVSTTLQSELARKQAAVSKRKSSGSLDETNELRKAAVVDGGDVDTTFDTSVGSSVFEEGVFVNDDPSGNRDDKQSSGYQNSKRATKSATAEAHFADELEMKEEYETAESNGRSQGGNGRVRGNFSDQTGIDLIESKQQRRDSGMSNRRIDPFRQNSHVRQSLDDIHEDGGDEQTDDEENQTTSSQTRNSLVKRQHDNARGSESKKSSSFKTRRASLDEGDAIEGCNDDDDTLRDPSYSTPPTPVHQIQESINNTGTSRQLSSGENNCDNSTSESDGKALRISSHAVGDVKVQVNGRQIVFTFDGAFDDDINQENTSAQLAQDIEDNEMLATDEETRQPSVLKKVFDTSVRANDENPTGGSSHNSSVHGTNSGKKSSVRFTDAVQLASDTVDRDVEEHNSSHKVSQHDLARQQARNAAAENTPAQPSEPLPNRSGSEHVDTKKHHTTVIESEEFEADTGRRYRSNTRPHPHPTIQDECESKHSFSQINNDAQSQQANNNGGNISADEQQEHRRLRPVYDQEIRQEQSTRHTSDIRVADNAEHHISNRSARESSHYSKPVRDRTHNLASRRSRKSIRLEEHSYSGADSDDVPTSKERVALQRRQDQTRGNQEFAEGYTRMNTMGNSVVEPKRRAERKSEMPISRTERVSRKGSSQRNLSGNERSFDNGSDVSVSENEEQGDDDNEEFALSTEKRDQLYTRYKERRQHDRDERRKSPTEPSLHKLKTRRIPEASEYDRRGISSSQRVHKSRNQRDAVAENDFNSEEDLSEGPDTPDVKQHQHRHHRSARYLQHEFDDYSDGDKVRRRSDRDRSSKRNPRHFSDTVYTRDYQHRSRSTKHLDAEPGSHLHYRTPPMETRPNDNTPRTHKMPSNRTMRETTKSKDIHIRQKLPEGIVWPPGMEEECIARLGLDGHHPMAPPGLEHLVTEEQWGEYWTWLHWYSSWQMWYMKNNDKKPHHKSQKKSREQRRRAGDKHLSDAEAEYHENRGPSNANWWLEVGDSNQHRR